MEYPSDVAFSPAVKLAQTHKGSRSAYSRMEQDGSWETHITPQLREFIEAQTSVFFATASAHGQPYIQHRGGPAGFLRVLDPQSIGFADYIGNRQFITVGNLSENPKAHIFLIDYAQRRRVKIWGEAQVVEDTELTAQLMPPGYRARAAQSILFKVVAWDENCPQHIPQKFDAGDVTAALAERDRRIARLQSEIELLRAQLSNR